jgi:hypothetical protein
VGQSVVVSSSALDQTVAYAYWGFKVHVHAHCVMHPQMSYLNTIKIGHYATRQYPSGLSAT